MLRNRTNAIVLLPTMGTNLTDNYSMREGICVFDNYKRVFIQSILTFRRQKCVIEKSARLATSWSAVAVDSVAGIAKQAQYKLLLFCTWCNAVGYCFVPKSDAS